MALIDEPKYSRSVAVAVVLVAGLFGFLLLAGPGTFVVTQGIHKAWWFLIVVGALSALIGYGGLAWVAVCLIKTKLRTSAQDRLGEK